MRAESPFDSYPNPDPGVDPNNPFGDPYAQQGAGAAPRTAQEAFGTPSWDAQPAPGASTFGGDQVAQWGAPGFGTQEAAPAPAPAVEGPSRLRRIGDAIRGKVTETVSDPRVRAEALRLTTAVGKGALIGAGVELNVIGVKRDGTIKAQPVRGALTVAKAFSNPASAGNALRRAGMGALSGGQEVARSEFDGYKAAAIQYGTEQVVSKLQGETGQPAQPTAIEATPPVQKVEAYNPFGLQ